MDWQSYFLAGLIGPVFWLVVLSVALWLVRRFLPPKWEKILFTKYPKE